MTKTKLDVSRTHVIKFFLLFSPYKGYFEKLRCLGKLKKTVAIV